MGVGHTTKRPKPYSFTGELANLAKTLGFMAVSFGSLLSQQQGDVFLLRVHMYTALLQKNESDWMRLKMEG